MRQGLAGSEHIGYKIFAAKHSRETECRAYSLTTVNVALDNCGVDLIPTSSPQVARRVGANGQEPPVAVNESGRPTLEIIAARRPLC